MKTRTILFRAKRTDNWQWTEGFYVVDPQGNHRIYCQPFAEASSNTWFYVDPSTVSQYTGLQDRNGNKIWEGDKVKCRYKIGEDSDGLYTNSIYKVNDISYEGLSLSFLNIIESDDHKLNYPITRSPSFKSGSLCVDYVNANYNSLAISETFGENSIYKRTWKENHYSSDIEVIDRKSTRLNSSHLKLSRMPSSA